ncbi:tetratricopeptide repeat protein [Kaarinaea lacus]
MINKKVTAVLIILLALISNASMADVDPWTESYRLESLYQYNAAVNALDAAANKDPNSELLFLRRGWLQYLAGNHSKSIEYYKKAMSINGQSLEARLGIILPLMAQQRWREATLEANKVLEVAPWNYYAHIRLMTCEHALQQWPTLEKHAQQVTARYPTDASVLVFLARASHHIGNKDRAINAYQRVLQLSPDHFEAGQYLARSMP